MRLMPFLAILSWLVVAAIPVALFMIWAQLGHLNEELRVRRIIDEARIATAERSPTQTPRQPSPIRSAVANVVEKLEEKLVEPAVRSAPRQETGPDDRTALKSVARALDARAPKPPPIRENEETLFLLIDQESKGPFALSEVLRRIREGNLSHTVLCRTADTMDWTPLEVLTANSPEDTCSSCGRPTVQGDLQPNGKLICAQCRKFAPRNSQ